MWNATANFTAIKWLCLNFPPKKPRKTLEKNDVISSQIETYVVINF